MSRKCEQTVCFQVSSHCPQPTTQLTIPQNTSNSQKLQLMLNQSLHEQAAIYHQQIDELSAEIYKLKTTLQRLQLRNKHDKQAEKALRVEYNLLLIKLKESKEQIVTREKEIVQVVKNMPVQVQSPALLEELARLRKNNELLSHELSQLKIDKNLVQSENQRLKEDVARLCHIQQKLHKQINELLVLGDDRERTIQKLTEMNTFLKTNKEVVKETKHMFPDFRAGEKIRTETKVETVYVQKPVERTVFVEVPQRIKQFVQPERALVNRVITCPTVRCRCEDEDEEKQSRNYKEEITRMDRELTQLQSHIDLFGQQRQKLVGIIGDKNSELNSLQNRIRLMQVRPSQERCEPHINVTVTRLKHHHDHSEYSEQEEERITRVRK